MPANNFVGVTVTCGVTTHTVGGSINGLTSSGLVLMNGSDVLTVAANAASFTMPTGAASGSAYAVVVQRQPSGELCTVGNGSGMVAGGDVNSVQVNCGPLVLNFTAVGAATWTVPNGVASIQVVATGGGGGGEGNTGGSLGGNGGVVTVTLAVTAGDVVNLNVGGGGGNGEYGASGSFGGGGGGGYGGGGGGFFGGGGGGGSIGPAGAVFSLAANSGGSAAPGGDGSLVITISP